MRSFPKIESNLMAVRLGNPARCSDQNALRTWFTLILALLLEPAGWALARGGDTAMKTKSHGSAFAYPVAPLMWKSGTRHVSMASSYLSGAPDRDVKIP
jgi:hypothetical protein